MSELIEKYFEKVERNIGGGKITFYQVPNTRTRFGHDDASVLAKMMNKREREIKDKLIKNENKLYEISPEHTHVGIKLMADEVRNLDFIAKHNNVNKEG